MLGHWARRGVATSEPGEPLPVLDVGRTFFRESGHWIASPIDLHCTLRWLTSWPLDLPEVSVQSTPTPTGEPPESHRSSPRNFSMSGGSFIEPPPAGRG